MLKDLKIITSDYTGKSISELPDNPSEAGFSAADLKARFDALSKALQNPRFNQLIDILVSIQQGNSGAHNIGFASNDTRVQVDNVYDALMKAFDYVDQTLINIGAGDMTKLVYDQNSNGVVDSSEVGQTLRVHTATYNSGIYALSLPGYTNTGKLFNVYFNQASGSETVQFKINDETTKNIVTNGVVRKLSELAGKVVALRFNGTEYVSDFVDFTFLAKSLENNQIITDLRTNKKYKYFYQISSDGLPQMVYEEVL